MNPADASSKEDCPGCSPEAVGRVGESIVRVGLDSVASPAPWAVEVLGAGERGGRAGREDRAKRGPPGSPGLPCLNSHNSDNGLVPDSWGSPRHGAWNEVSPSHLRTAFCVSWEIRRAAEKFGLEHLAFLTLTFKDDIRDIREAQRRFNNFNRRWFKREFLRGIGCWERTLADRVHFHFVVVLPFDCRTGFDFEAVRRYPPDYSSACDNLRGLWARLRDEKHGLPAYGFGRHELLPIKSTAEGLARYLGKYLGKHTSERRIEDCGAHVVRFIGFKAGDRTCSSRFALSGPANPKSVAWRQAVGEFSEGLGLSSRDALGGGSTDALSEYFGKHWAFHWRALILREPGLLALIGGEDSMRVRSLLNRYFQFCVDVGLGRSDEAAQRLPLRFCVPPPSRLLQVLGTAASDGDDGPDSLPVSDDAPF